jgi:hypothetical protein
MKLQQDGSQEVGMSISAGVNDRNSWLVSCWEILEILFFNSGLQELPRSIKGSFMKKNR